MLASPAMESPEMAATASGRNRASSMLSAANDTNSPLEVIEVKKSGPRPGLGFDSLTVIAIMRGTRARMPNPAWLRRRPKISRSSERRKRVDTCLSGRAAGRVGTAVVELVFSPWVTSAADIEALPCQRDEQVLKARALDRKPRYWHTVLHECHDNLFRCQQAQSAGSQTGSERNVGQPQCAHDACRVLWTVGDNPGSNLADGPHLSDRSLCQQGADMHDPDVGAH